MPDSGGSVLPVSRLLWRPPLTVRVGRAAHLPVGCRVVQQFIIAPHRRMPSLLVPVSSRRAAARAILRPSEGVRGLQRAGRTAASLALLAGVGQKLMRDRLYICADSSSADPLDYSADQGPAESIESYLQEVFGPDILLALAVGPMRANRKPVLQLLTPSGRTVAYVKVGWNALTRKLVRNEAHTLADQAPRNLGLVQPPRLLHAASWQDLALLAIAPLVETGASSHYPLEPPLRPMSALATSGGTEVAELAASPFWDRLGARIDRLEDARTRRTLLAVWLLAARHYGTTAVTFGAWHGDWTRWNMTWDGDRVLLWDWERYETGVPVGMDAFHYALQSRLRNPDDLDDAVTAVRRLAPSLAAGFDAEPRQGELLLLLYLLTLLLRYEEDSTDVMGAGLRPIAAALRSIVARQVAAL
jgi:hypothetical protein